MAQAVSRRPLTMEAEVSSRLSPCWIYGEQNGTGTQFSRSSSVSPVSIIPPWHSFIRWGMNIRPLVAAVKWHSLTPSTWTATIFITLMMETVRTSETSVYSETIRLSSAYSRHENLKIQQRGYTLEADTADCLVVWNDNCQTESRSSVAVWS
jgi:hypothetical protein